MDKVEVTKCMVGIFSMQVCAESNATDDDILEVCNSENPSGTSNGWSHVVRDKDALGAPCLCEDFAGRTHFLVDC